MAASAIVVEARRHVSDDHPFKNTDKGVVFHEDGSSSHKVEPVRDIYRKYDSLISSRDFKREHKTGQDLVNEFFYGK